MRPVERLLATARAEIGYIEKDTNAQLDDQDGQRWGRELEQVRS